MTQIALVVHTCDRYKLLYKGFEHFFKKYFPYGDVKLGYYFLTEEESFDSDIFTNIKTGKGEWSDRLLKGLKQLPEDYIIYFQEDMWLTKPVDADTFSKIINFSIHNRVKLFKLSSSDVNHNIPTGTIINGLAVAKVDNEKSRFLMSHQISVWDKAFLMDQLKYKEHPWRNERRGSKRLKKLNPEIYHIDLFGENENQPNNFNKDTDNMSRYYTVSQNAQLRSNTEPFINEMMGSADHGIKEYAQKLSYNYQNGITHDGRNKPRKEDVFKKIKNNIKALFKSA